MVGRSRLGQQDLTMRSNAKAPGKPARKAVTKAAGAPAAPSAQTGAGGAAQGRPGLAPFARRASRALAGLATAPRKPPQARRVPDLAPGERVPRRSRIVFRTSGAVLR
jgi:hypothetical protein